MRQNNDAGAGFNPVSQLSPLGSGIRMPASVRVLTAAFSRPLPSLGHLILGPPHTSLSPSLYFMEISWNPLPSLDWSLSHRTFTKTPRSAGTCFPTWLLPPPRGRRGSFFLLLPVNSVPTWHHRLSHLSLGNPRPHDDSLFSLQQRQRLCLCACSDLSDSSQPHGL